MICCWEDGSGSVVVVVVFEKCDVFVVSERMEIMLCCGSLLGMVDPLVVAAAAGDNNAEESSFIFIIVVVVEKSASVAASSVVVLGGRSMMVVPLVGKVVDTLKRLLLFPPTMESFRASSSTSIPLRASA